MRKVNRIFLCLMLIVSVGASTGSVYAAEEAADYARGRFRAQINVENLIDKRYFHASYNYQYVIPGDPFMIRGEVGFTF